MKNANLETEYVSKTFCLFHFFLSFSYSFHVTCFKPIESANRESSTEEKLVNSIAKLPQQSPQSNTLKTVQETPSPLFIIPCNRLSWQRLSLDVLRQVGKISGRGVDCDVVWWCHPKTVKGLSR